MAKLLEFASPAMCCGASLHGNNAVGLLGKEHKHLPPRKLLAKHNRPVGARAMQLENALCKVNADDGNFRHGCPLLL
jgi:hypothetical protein